MEIIGLSKQIRVHIIFCFINDYFRNIRRVSAQTTLQRVGMLSRL